MKILQIMAGGKHGGAETAFVDMCLAMHEAGENVEVITRNNEVRVPPLKEAGIKVHTLPFAGKADVYTHWAIRKIIKELQPSIVQTWMARAAWFTPRWKASMAIPPYVTFARLGGYYKLKNFKNTDYFVSLTPDIKKYLVDHKIDASKVYQINNFAEVEEVTIPVKRADLGTPDHAVVVLGLGRLHTSKAFDTLIKAVAQVPEIHLWIAGEGPEHGALEKLIASLDLQERVKLLGWRTDRAALLKASDICAFVSRYEPFGTVFVQAWAQQTPVLVSDAAGPIQYARHEEDSLVTPIDDVDAMAASLRRLAEDKNLRQKLAVNGFKRYQEGFTKELCVKNYLAAYHEAYRQEFP